MFLPMTHQRLKDFAQGKQFCRIVNYAIIAFAFLMGLETMLKDPQAKAIFNVLDYLFLAFFTLEIIIRILAEDHPGLYFVLFKRTLKTTYGVTTSKMEFTDHGFWNYFDFALIFLSLLGLFAQIFLHPAVLQVGRLFRIFRIIRLLEISEHLKEVERRIMSIVPTVFSFAVLLLILNYIYAILGMLMFDERVFATCSFSTVLDSFVTLFQVMTLDNWSDVMDDIKVHTPAFHPFFVQAYFVSFVVFTSIIAFNVFIAVMTSQVADRMESELQGKVLAEQKSDEKNQDQITESLNAVTAELRQLKSELIELRRRSPGV